jgi:dihydroorotate dehydrogenase/Pyruvate/2-oxoacid:ferredoxin oxidoreductase delta subunit
MIDLSIQLAGRRFDNPLQCGSGQATNAGEKIKRIALEGAPGAIVTKSVSVDMGTHWGRGKKIPSLACWPWTGTQADMDKKAGGKVCVVSASRGEPLTCDEWLQTQLPVALQGGVPVIGNAGGASDMAQWVYLAKEFERAGCVMVELNFGTPHAHQWGHGAVLLFSGFAFDVVRMIKRTVKIPVIAKLPYLSESDCAKYGPEMQNAGADILKACMPVGGTAIDIESGRPPIGIPSRTGIAGGPSHKPLALMNVFALAQHVTIPIIGSGGVCNGRDAIEHIMAGATAVEICTWMMLKGPGLFRKVNQEIVEWMEGKGYSSLSEIRGMALAYAGKEQADPYFPIINEDLCSGCGQCETLCSWVVHTVPAAIRVDKARKKAAVDVTRCEGCGRCHIYCPKGAIHLQCESA